MDELNNTNAVDSSVSSFSDTDVNDILHENNIDGLSSEDTSNDMNDIFDDTFGDENQGEGNDDVYPSAGTTLDPEFEDTLDGRHTSISHDEEALVPANSPTLLIDESTTRFSGAEWFSAIQNARIIIAGIGGIGSNLAFQLARMAPRNITLYDDDHVEAVNMAGQLYSSLDVGSTKVDAMASMMSTYTSIRQINAIPEKFTPNSAPCDIMMCGFDNMRARNVFFTSWLHHVASKEDDERHKCLFLDGRLSMDTLQILCLTGDDTYNIERYQREFLFGDIEAENTVCSMKQTTYLACMIGSLMTNLFTNFVANSLSPAVPYDLPFFTEYDAQNMLFKTES